MQPSFNLIDQAWIPCVTPESDLIDVSLRDLLVRAPELREICCETPIQSAAVPPLLLALLHRVFGPAALADWQALWDARAFDMPRIDAYFAQWHECFDLFHPQRPFYQAIIENVQAKSLIHLLHAKGNTAAFFNHETDEEGIEVSPAEALRLLITSRHFRTCGPGPFIDGKRSRFKHSPYTAGVIFWAQGSTLFETLLLNLMLYGNESPMPSSADDVPAWETDEPFAQRSKPHGYLDYLTWSNNRIQLIPQFNDGRLVVREAIVAPAIEIDWRTVPSPQKRNVCIRERGARTYSCLRFNPDKALWRDYHSLLPQTAEESPPAVVSWLHELIQDGLLPENYPLRLMATGMLVIDYAKVLFYREEFMPLPPAILQEADHIADIAEAIKQAEAVGDALDEALDTLAQHILLCGGDGKTTEDNRKGLIRNWNAGERYWAELERRFRPFIDDLINDSDKAKRDWTIALHKTALDALALASRRAGGRPWALKGGAFAEHDLFCALKKITGEEVQAMRSTQTWKHRFVRHLEDNADDRAMRADLQDGLGREPGAVPARYRHIVPFLNTGKEADLLLIASLFAFHPLSDSKGNMGDHMRALAGERSSQANENHVLRLLDMRRDTLETPLWQAISILKNQGIAVNWHQLMYDIRDWDRADHIIQRKWARAFWQPAQSNSAKRKEDSQ